MQDALKERIAHIGETSATKDVYRKQRLKMGLLKNKSMEASTKQSVLNKDFQLAMLKASVDYNADLFGKQEIKSVEQAAETREVREDQREALPKVGKRSSANMVPCTPQGRLFEYSKHTQDVGYVPQFIRDVRVGTICS